MAGLRVWSVAVAVGPGPDELQAVLAFDLDQRGVDRVGEARIVQLHREVVALAGLSRLLPGRPELYRAREDAKLRALVGRVLDPLDASLDVEVEGFDRAGEAVAVGGEGADGSHLSSP
jgi:hypothetical protein